MIHSAMSWLFSLKVEEALTLTVAARRHPEGAHSRIQRVLGEFLENCLCLMWGEGNRIAKKYTTMQTHHKRKR